MSKILFDCSTHLGQFTIGDEALRKGCKESQASISPVGDTTREGMWTDLDNGRADRTIWNLCREAQDTFYPWMDRFCTDKVIQQPCISDEDLQKAQEIQKKFPHLHLYSRISCGRAILNQADEFHTLVAELLDDPVMDFMDKEHGVRVGRPWTHHETSYDDPVLERCYQDSLETFRRLGIDILNQLEDPRALIL